MNQLVKTTDLLTIDPKHFVAETYQPFTEALEAAIAKAPTLTYEISTKQGMTVAKEGRAIFRDIRIALEKKRAAAKAPILEIGKLLDSRAKEIVQRIEPFEEQFDKDIKVEESRIEAEKAAKDKAEAERQADMQAEIDYIRNAPLKSVGVSSAGIQEIIDHLNCIDPQAANFAERADEAVFVRKEALSQLQSMLEGKKAQEELQAQQEAQRIENGRIAAELEAKRKAEEDRQREALKEEAERQRIQAAEIAKQRAELEAMQAKINAAQEAHLAAERAKMENELRVKAAEEAKVHREAEAKAHAEYETGMMAEQAKIADLQKTLDRGEEIEASRKNAQLKAQEQPFKSGGMPVKDSAPIETVTISKKEYEQLCEDALMLSCLRAAGVDNWEGWGDAMDDYHQSMEAA